MTTPVRAAACAGPGRPALLRALAPRPATLLLAGLTLALSVHGCSCGGGGDPIALPTLAFVGLEPGVALGPEDDLDLSTEGLQLDVTLQTSDLRAGAQISLLVGDEEQPLVAPVDDEGLVTFELVTLPQGVTVTLVAHTADGQVRTAVDVSVGQWELSLRFLSPAQAEVLTRVDDADPLTDGFQYDVRVEGRDLPAGTAIRLQVAGAATGSPAYLDDVGRALFGSVTLPPGDAVVLVAEADYRELSLSDTVTISVPDAPLADPTVRFVDLDDGQVLDESDDVDGDLLDGFQVDINLATEHVADGRLARLRINGALHGDEVAVLSDTVTFERVTLPEAPPGGDGVHLSVSVTDAQEREATADLTIFVSTGRCVVQVEEMPRDGCEILEDPVPATPEVETTFVVTTNCSSVTLYVNQAPVGDNELPEGGGSTTFRGVPLAQGVNDVAVEASGSGGRTGSLEGLRYEVDTVRPELGFTEIAQPGEEATLFVIADDLDRDTEGVQIELRGWVTDVVPGEQDLTLSIQLPDGEPLEELPAVPVLEALDGQGRNLFLVWPLTLPQSGTYELSIAGSDACDQVGQSATYTFRADVVRPELTIVRPEPDAVLLAADDLDPEQAGFQTMIQVAAEHVPAGEALEVRCGARDGVVRSTVGSALTPEGDGEVAVDVPVTLAEGWRACYAAYEGANSAESEPVVFLVAGERPSVTFVAPSRQRVNTPTVRVSVLTSRIADGRPVQLSLNGEPYPEPMIVQGGGASLPAVALQPGDNVLHAEGSDEVGNSAEDERRVVLDTEAPALDLLSPEADSTLGLEDDRDGDPGNGIQVDVRVGVTGLAAEETGNACLWLDGSPVADCVNAPVSVAGPEVVFAGVRLAQGVNHLLVRVVDGAGNAGQVEATVSLDIAAPTCELLPVDDDDCVALGAGVRVEVLTDAPDGASAYITVGGQDQPVVPTSEGRAVFMVDLPADADSVLEARIEEPGRPPSYCRSRNVQVRTTPGSLVFVAPEDGAVLNAAVPSTGYPGFRVDVRLQAEPVMRGQLAALEVQCGGGDPYTAEATVEPDGDGGAELLFEDVPLLDLAACTLQAVSTNCAGGVAEAEAAISVDRIPPEVEFLFPLDGATLSFRNDVDPATDGMQTFVNLRVAGVPVGTAVRLIVPGREAYEAELEAGDAVHFPRVEVADGVAVPLRAEVVDPAGNTATAVVLLAEVVSGEPSIAFASPDEDTTWLARDDLDPAVEGLQQEFRFVTAYLAEDTEVRLCSDNHDGEGVFCGRPGFQVVGTRTS